jgi:hypothetical protein
MNRPWIHYEICTEDEQGLYPFGLHYSTKGEAEAELKTYLPENPTAFIITVVKTRCAERIPHRFLQAV